jgi:hypothetical protein
MGRFIPKISFRDNKLGNVDPAIKEEAKTNPRNISKRIKHFLKGLVSNP